MKKILPLSIFIFLSGTGFSQINQFWLVQQFFNPSVTGAHYDHEAHALVDYQHFDPNVDVYYTFLGYSTKLNKWNSGLGFTFDRRSNSYTNRTDGELTYAYHMKLSEKSRLSMGLSMGIHQYDMSAVNGYYYDQYLVVDTIHGGKGSTFSAGLGMTYRANRFKLGISANQLTKGKVRAGDFTFNETIGYYLYSSYYFGDSSRFSFQPVMMYRLEDQFSEFQIGLVSNYKEMISVGLSARFRDSYTLSVGYTFKNTLTLSYAFETTISKLNNNNLSGIHEVHLGWKFNRRTK